MTFKRLLALLLLTTSLILFCPALADVTEEEWNANCNWVIAQDATLYSATYKEAFVNSTDVYDFAAIGTIAAGTRVSIRSSSSGMREICYWHDGQKSAWVENAAVIWDGGVSITGGLQLTDAWNALDVTLYLGEGKSEEVTLQELGTAQSVVYNGQELLTVPTEDLYWESEADDAHRLAVIHAPRTGKATLRASASSSAKSLGQCEAGRIVLVLKVGTTFTRILYDGKEGCVLTDALTFHAAVPENDFSSATLAYNDRTDTAATISLYADNEGKRRIDQWRVGTDIVVLSRTEAWVEAEIDGWHGWLRSDYLE